MKGLSDFFFSALVVLATSSCAPDLFKSLSSFTPFSMKVSAPPKAVRGGSTLEIKYKVSSTNRVVFSVSLEAQLDGAHFETIANLPPQGEKYSWPVPLINRSDVVLRLKATDTLLSEGSVLSDTFKVITGAPLLTQDLVVSPAANGFDLLIFGGRCSLGMEVKVAMNGSPSTSAECDLGKWALPISVIEDGKRDLVFSQTNDFGDTTTVSATWTRDTIAPALSFKNTPLLPSNASIDLTVLCEAGLDVLLKEDGISVSEDDPPKCPTGKETFTLSPTSEGLHMYSVSQTDRVNTSEISTSWIYETTPPTVVSNSVRVGNGLFTSIGFIPVDFSARGSLTPIQDLCFKYVTGSLRPSPAVPAKTDACWNPVNNPEGANLPPTINIEASRVPYRLGFAPGIYDVYVFVKDLAGNISSNTAYGSIDYQPGQPPKLVNVLATGTAKPSFPPGPQDIVVAQGAPLYIRWNLSAPNGVNPNPLSLFYTKDDVNWTPLATHVADRDRCPSSGFPAGFSTGCYVWSSSAAKSTEFLKIRVSVTDKNGTITFASSNFLNDTALTSLAGNTEDGLGASAASAMLFNERSNVYYPDPGSFAVHKDGTFFFRDMTRGVLWVHPKDGVLKTFIPAGTNYTYEGPIAGASVKRPAKIALDYTNHLLIWDTDRIRSVDLGTLTIKTIIGGGTSSADGVRARSVRFPITNDIQQISVAQKTSPLVALPNGDIYFQVDNYQTLQARLRVYHADTEQVDSIYVSGEGHGENPGEFDIEHEDLQSCSTVVSGRTIPCYFAGFNFAFDPANSLLTALHVAVVHAVSGDTLKPFVSLSPTGATIGRALPMGQHPPSEGNSDADHFRFAGRDGKIYVIDKILGRISKFNSASNHWDLVAGTGSPRSCSTSTQYINCPVAIGDCNDGTDATSCAMAPDDAFVDSFGTLYFMDRGRLRTLDGAGKVRTVYGQSYSYGDGGTAISSRFNIIDAVDVADDGHLVLIDRTEARIRSISAVDGSITTLAGNGGFGAPAWQKDAAKQPLQILSGGQANDLFRLDPATGEIYFQGGANRLYRLPANGGAWEHLIATLPGSVSVEVLGFANGKALLHTDSFDVSINSFADPLLMIFDKTIGDYSVLASYKGAIPFSPNSICADGTKLSNCILPHNAGPQLAPATFLDALQSWLILMPKTRAVRLFSTAPGSVADTYTSLDRPALSFSYKKDPQTTVESIYYCAADPVSNLQTIYEHTLGSGTADVPLHWPVAAIQCAGKSLAYDARLNRLVFPYLENGLYGVAQYKLP